MAHGCRGPRCAARPDLELAPVVRRTLPDAAARVPATRPPLALRLGLDGWLLAGSAVVFWLTARGGYQVVVVPEGVPVASVNYAALLAPALAWPGMGLLAWRVTTLALSPGPATGRGPTGRMPDLRHEVVRRRQQVIARGGAGVAIAVAVTRPRRCSPTPTTSRPGSTSP